MNSSQKKDYSGGNQVASHITSKQSNYSKKMPLGKHEGIGFRVQITELNHVSRDTVEALIQTLEEAGITQINYLPFDGIARSH